MLRHVLVLLGLIVLGILSCGGDDGASSVVVGVTSDFRGGVDLDRLEVTMTVDGATLSQSTLPVDGDTFPAELELVDVAPGANLAVTLRGFLGSDARVVRHVTTDAPPAGQRGLVRLHLEQRCDLVDDGDGLVAPTCNEASETCISGKCQSAVGSQKPYEPDWATSTNDACKSGGPPEVIAGVGQSDFFAADDYEVAQVEAGPQGGHHIWVAARVKNLRRSGSITEIGGEIPSMGLSITPLKVIFTLETDEGGYCKIFGLRFQLDIDGAEIETLLGEPIEIFVTVVDSDGDQATDAQWLTLSDDIL